MATTTVKTRRDALRSAWKLALAEVQSLRDSIDADVKAMKALPFDASDRINPLFTKLSAVVTAINDLIAQYPSKTVSGINYDVVLPEVIYNGAILEAEGVSGAIATALVASGSDMIRIHKPTADFSVDDVTGTTSQTLVFTDSSTNAPVSWAWDFGDGKFSTVQNPSKKYDLAGTYTVILTATNAGGSSTRTKTNYITIT